MSLHISAAPREIASTVLITGDPLRARYIAEQMLTDVRCYSEVRGMLGFTGMFLGKPVSIQGTGIGIPSTALYVHELIHEYDVQKIIRIGTCGAIQPHLQLHQLILAIEAYTDSFTNHMYHDDLNKPCKADNVLMVQARDLAHQHSISLLEGAVFSTDTFYSEDSHRWDNWRNRGLLAVEMESSILFAIAAKNSVQAISILTVSDNIINGATTISIERQEVSEEMILLGLGLV